MSQGFVHVFNPGGHRGFYQEFLSEQLDLEPITGRLGWALAARLIRANSLLFATIGPKTSLRAVLVAAVRACLGKRTTAVCMEKSWYLDGGRPRLSALVLRLFHFLDARGRFKVLLIIPYELLPEGRETTSEAILDLCLWDQLDEQAIDPQIETPLSSRAREVASGRRIVVFLGKASRRKGYGDLAPLARQYSEQAFFVSAGAVDSECVSAAAELRESGMLVEDRRISEDELISLYGAADYVWCQYDESSLELSSGIFGRAVQLGKISVVRKGSYLDQLADFLGCRVVHDLGRELERVGDTGPPLPGSGDIGAQDPGRLQQLADRSLEVLRCSL